MSPESILAQCTAEGVSVSVDGDKLIAVGSQAALDEWRPLLRSTKEELLAYLEPDRELVQLRATHFVGQGVPYPIAQSLAKRLRERDAVCDDRRLCLECGALYGTRQAPRCFEWIVTGMLSPQLPVELPLILRRCKGFRPATQGTCPSVFRPESAWPAHVQQS
jgi:hypothetical protein